MRGYADTQSGELVRTRPRSFRSFRGQSRSVRSRSWQQIERGKLALDDRVADYWPAFAANGKEAGARSAYPVPPRRIPGNSAGTSSVRLWGDTEVVNRGDRIDAAEPPGGDRSGVSLCHATLGYR